MDDIFWENIEQARDRLIGTYILHGDTPVCVESISATGTCTVSDPFELGLKEFPLSDPQFHRFHKLPSMGFVNLVGFKRPLAVFLKRIPERSRSHGIKPGKVTVLGLTAGDFRRSEGINYNAVLSDKGYKECIKGNFPNPKEICDFLSYGESAAFSSKYAILRDTFGMFWLFRGDKRIGLLLDQKLSLSKTTECFAEELKEIPDFANISIQRLD